MGERVFSGRSYSGQHVCDTLAADPLDAARFPGTGVAAEKIDTAKAIPACTEAAYEYGRTIRFRYQAARALIIANQDYDAVDLMASAAGEEYVAAYKGLAGLYLNFATTSFDRVEDLQTAYMLLDSASTGGYPVPEEDTYRVLQELYSIWFSEEGYTTPQLFREIYEGTLDFAKAKINFDVEETIIRLLYTQIAYCGPESSISQSLGVEDRILTLVKVTTGQSAREGLGPPDDPIVQMRLAAKLQSWIEDNIDSPDPVLFMARHGCDTQVSMKFQNNLRLHALSVSENMRSSKLFQAIILPLRLLEQLQR